jgi:hypothetical protein
MGHDPLVGAKAIDSVNGTLNYALARVGPTNAAADSQGNLAVLTFKVKPGANGVLQIKLTKLGLSDAGFADILGLAEDVATMDVAARP